MIWFRWKAVDSYGLTARQRRGFLSQIIEFAICSQRSVLGW
jgi:hypothetical protein